ncbi:MAG: CheR family methyltransferase [Formivibrio sp.]|nr:CheR family methyltransferase [Formivibrio sp.]
MSGLDLNPFKELVRQRCGLQFEAMAEFSLLLAVQKRMSATQSGLASAYYARLLCDAVEFEELVSLLTINETYFYREPKQLELLVNRLLPELLSKGRGLPLRILSAGCSTGEEPYSIAIAILEKFGEAASKMVTIVAGDIDQHALRRARRAQYNEYAFRGMPPALRQRYFTPVQDHAFQLGQGVREMVEFHPLNLLAQKLPAVFVDFDIVFFRNVSIYFDAPTRLNIQHVLRTAMRETGYLVLGSAETLANDQGVFHLEENGGQFYFRKGSLRPTPSTRPVKAAVMPQGKARAPMVPVKAKVPPVLIVMPTPEEHREKIEALRALVRAKQYSAALAQITSLRRIAPVNTDVQLLESYVFLQMRRFAEAAAMAQQVLKHETWSVDAMMLLGFAAKWRDDRTAAIGHFKLAAYTRPDCWPAHYFLGNMLLEIEVNKAQRAYRTALMQLTSNPDPDGGLRLPLDLPVADIRFLCERRLASAGSRS